MLNKRASYTVLGHVPELNYVLLRDNRTGQVEAWTKSRGVEPQAIVVSNVELEYVRPVRAAYRIPDNEFNRIHQLDNIGRIYVDEAPQNALVEELK